MVMGCRMFMRLTCFVSVLLSSVLAACADEQADHAYQALGAPAQRKTDIAWNRYHDHAGLHAILKQLNEVFPDLTKLYSIGKSYEGRDLWCLEVTNRNKGNPSRKPGMYIDGNIHGNEVQAGEVVAYAAWYLCENYGHIPKVTQVVDDHVFYLIPTINPDGRDHWFHAAHTQSSSRSGKVPYDNDRDGLVDEDDYDDLDGDGSITRMRIKDPNGRWKPDPEYPEYLMIRAKPDEKGEYTLLGREGIDNDGDGRINEDPAGGYDSNRNWAWDWQPRYIQRGAHEYPFSLPNTRAVAEFVISHPNIAGSQSFHNSGGMILRGPGREGGDMQPADEKVLTYIAERGEKMLPHYKSLISWKDLYTTLGDEMEWFYGARGILGLVNELWTSANLYREELESDEAGRRKMLEFVRYLLMNDGLVAWHEVEHPTYGKIEVGGTKKEIGRVPPSFLLEEECHRNALFTVYHAEMMPLVKFGRVTSEKLDRKLYKVWVEVINEGLMPTRSAQDVAKHISPPDIMSVSGERVRVISSGRVIDRFFK
ncbi:MAG: peptidase M14, partial [Candidatus Hydrogenedentes bacterium]|nr:peptidase M14 [Candidatus Hydrogenedentota bacterium]